MSVVVDANKLTVESPAIPPRSFAPDI